MTDEERIKLIARFRAHEVVMWTDINLAANELERIARVVNYLAQEIAGPEGIVNDVIQGASDAVKQS